jgi:hypothetical protein
LFSKYNKLLHFPQLYNFIKRSVAPYLLNSVPSPFTRDQSKRGI